MRLSLPWKNLTPEERASGDPASPFSSGPDDRSGAVYLLNEELKVAAETALVIQRPLLILGAPGCGKSSFAPFVARNLNWRYYEFDMQRRSQCRDLLWRFDALARLRDAQAGQSLEEMKVEKYLAPGILWWAINREDAERCVDARVQLGGSKLDEPNSSINENRDQDRAVILIDEIDKADTDVPGDMLDLLGSYRFTVDENGHKVSFKRPLDSQNVKDLGKVSGPLIIFTSNQDKDLPPAFVRRCVICKLERIAQSQLVEIAKLHFGSGRFSEIESLASELADVCVNLARPEIGVQREHVPSAAEYLDALRACIRFGVQVKDSDETWVRIRSCTLMKPR